MDQDDLESTSKPIEVMLELFRTENGGRHTPLSPEENWRPDMYFEENDRQFWGQLNTQETLEPGCKGKADLFAVFPKDLSDFFTPGRKIRLIMGPAILGVAIIE